MANRGMTIADQLNRAAEALEDIDTRKNATPLSGDTLRSASPAPAGSLSAELLRSDGLLRYGR